jgi:release factor glutamine methyltransferase
MSTPNTNAPTLLDRLVVERPKLAPVLYAMWSRSEGRRLGAELRQAGVPVMLLKGPELQDRLYGTPAAYESSDVDVLIRARDARLARATMRAHGWRFEPENGVLWRLSAAASYERKGFRADLHWGLHAAHLPSWAMRPLEQALWAGAAPDPSGFLVPDAESLFVFLAVHVVGHRFERPEWVRNVHAAAALVSDWDLVWHIANEARVTTAVRESMSDRDPGFRIPVLDGVIGRTIWWSTYVMRGHAVPKGARDRIREALALRREGFGFTGRTNDRLVTVGDLELIVEPGVFEPQGVTLRGVDLASDLLGDKHPSVVIDIGTGAGLLAFASARRWPSAEVFGGDRSPRAVHNSERNADRLGVTNVRFGIGSLLQAMPDRLQGRVDLAFSNVPYVPPAGGRRSTKGWHMPLATIYGPDADGLGLMRELCRELPFFLRPGGIWVFQIGDSQWEPWCLHLSEHGFEPISPTARRRGNAIVAAARWKGSLG